MAAFYMVSAPICINSITHNVRRRSFISKSMTKATLNESHVELHRRSGNYQPSVWDHHSLLSIDNKLAKNEKVITRDLLKKKVKKMLDSKKNYLEQLELIDDLQKLGVSYHFEQEINKILTDLHEKNVWERNKEEDVHAIALQFRLLRQNGFNVLEDIFDGIVDKIEDGTFMSADIKSIISLYEASYLAAKSDTILPKTIKPFAIDQLKKFVDHHNDDTYNSEVRETAIHALEMPYHWRMRRLETRWNIDAYEKKHNVNHVLLDFAKHEFNYLQIVHQEDLKYVSSWWKETCISKQLPFVRDRIVEHYFWAVGIINDEPQYVNARRIIAIVNALITTLDDTYDVYGTLQELELFTDVVEAWDVNRLDELPQYMKICFLTLYNEINEIGCDILKQKNINVISYLKKSWADLCKSYLVEAKWYARGYKPSMEEYMQNACISISAQTILIHFYCVFSDQISIQMLESVSQHQHHLIRCSAIILRLVNDLGTSSDELARGDVLKSVQCYMHETGASEESARAHVMQMISDTWDEMNHETQTTHSSTLVSRGLMDASMNLARMSQCMYQHGDGHGSPEKAKTVDRIQSLLFDPIPLD